MNKEGVMNRKDRVIFDQRAQCGLSLAKVSLYENKFWLSQMDVWVNKSEKQNKKKKGQNKNIQYYIIYFIKNFKIKNHLILIYFQF